MIAQPGDVSAIDGNRIKVPQWDSIKHTFVCVIFVTVMLSGCAAATVQKVEVPVPVFCDPPAVRAPGDPLDTIKDTDDIFIMTRGLWAAIESRDGYIGSLNAALDACRKHE